MLIDKKLKELVELIEIRDKGDEGVTEAENKVIQTLNGDRIQATRIIDISLRYLPDEDFEEIKKIIEEKTKAVIKSKTIQLDARILSLKKELGIVK